MLKQDRTFRHTMLSEVQNILSCIIVRVLGIFWFRFF